MVAVRTFKNWINGGGLKIFHVNVGVSHNEGGGNPIQCWLHHGQNHCVFTNRHDYYWHIVKITMFSLSKIFIKNIKKEHY